MVTRNVKSQPAKLVCMRMDALSQWPRPIIDIERRTQHRTYRAEFLKPPPTVEKLKAHRPYAQMLRSELACCPEILHQHHRLKQNRGGRLRQVLQQHRAPIDSHHCISTLPTPLKAGNATNAKTVITNTAIETNMGSGTTHEPLVEGPRPTVRPPQVQTRSRKQMHGGKSNAPEGNGSDVTESELIGCQVPPPVHHGSNRRANGRATKRHTHRWK
jgi:hypothetical protein